MIYHQPYITVPGLHINEKAAVSACQADQLPLSLQKGEYFWFRILLLKQKGAQKVKVSWRAAWSDLRVVPIALIDGPACGLCQTRIQARGGSPLSL